MRRRMLRSALVAAVAIALAVPAAAGAQPRAAGSATLPAHIYAPYFETWVHDRISQLAQRSGARYFTLAFLQAPTKGSCTVAWNGDPHQSIASQRYIADIARLRVMGGDVIPSFGGYSADHGGTEIADSCTDVKKVAAVYESVVQRYNVTRLDMDVEARSLNSIGAINRRNKAIALAQAWAAQHGRTLQIEYTLPVEPAGLEASGLHVLHNAVADGVDVNLVNIMVFDYYDGTTTRMGAAAMSAAKGLHAQLAALYPAKTPRQLWTMEAMTILPGIDDYPQKTEVTYLSDAARILGFAHAHDMGMLSIWALQRDNGGCPGAIDHNGCSGIRQPRWAFSHVFEPFTG